MSGPSLFMGPDELAAFDHHFHRSTRNLVARVDPLPLTSDEKHEMVKQALLRFGVARLQGSVKELRDVPAEALAVAADLLISSVVGLIRAGLAED